MKNTRTLRTVARVGIALWLCMLPACDDGLSSADDMCMSGQAWTGGDEESPRMHPGRDCIGCHTREDEGPRFAAAGTVFPGQHEPDECYGVEGVIVELTGDDGATIRTVTNEAGNFFFESPELALTPPYTARLVFEGRERIMLTPQASGACASCHTADGASNAPGRILVP